MLMIANAFDASREKGSMSSLRPNRNDAVGSARRKIQKRTPTRARMEARLITLPRANPVDAA